MISLKRHYNAGHKISYHMLKRGETTALEITYIYGTKCQAGENLTVKCQLSTPIWLNTSTAKTEI